MNCFKCGAALEGGARFCGACGSQQPGAVVPQAAVKSNQKTMFQGGGPAKPGAAGPGPKKDDMAFAQTIAPPSSSAPAAKPAGGMTHSQKMRAIMPKAAPAPVVEELTGKTLNNRYAVAEKLGEGGFGSVYRARQTTMDREVALKVLHPKMAKDPQILGRFKREAQASSQLRAPHTVQVYDFDETPEGVMYLAMELLQGKSLHVLLHQEGPMQWQRLARVIDGLAESLAEAHTRGIVHRDIKPENVYLEPQPEPDFVKVLDFGIAKIVSGDGMKGPQLTAAGQTLGTLEYMSPEQLMGQQLDGRSDLYAVGIMAYELVTGRLPFDAKTPTEMITGHLKTVPKPPSQMAPGRGIPKELDVIVLKLLEKTREKRFKDAAELREALKPVMAGTVQPAAPVAAAPAPAAASAPAKPAAPEKFEEEHTDRVGLPGSKPKSGSPLVLLIVAAVVAVLAGLGAVWWLSK